MPSGKGELRSSCLVLEWEKREKKERYREVKGIGLEVEVELELRLWKIGCD